MDISFVKRKRFTITNITWAIKHALSAEKVNAEEGTYYGGRLIHWTCNGIAKIQRYNLNGDN
ncbi:MAG: hypothetical protein FWG55_01350 [Candidatus Bathyarchaeota archaeon]|nr:hypothetical protein [Candidatus Termiticorpusculum sp.]